MVTESLDPTSPASGLLRVDRIDVILLSPSAVFIARFRGAKGHISQGELDLSVSFTDSGTHKNKFGLSRENDRALRRLGQDPKKWMFPLGFIHWKPQVCSNALDVTNSLYQYSF